MRDELTGATFDWGQHNPVRLDPYAEPAHVFTVTRNGTAAHDRHGSDHRQHARSARAARRASRRRRHGDPHPAPRRATSVAVVDGDDRHPMRTGPRGASSRRPCPARSPTTGSRSTGGSPTTRTGTCPRSASSTCSCIAEGRHERLWTVLGARAHRDDGVAFAVWAPNAQGVRVVGDFTGWGPHDGWPMRSMGSSGVWELLVPDATPGQRYKYRILGRDGVWREKADPLADLRRGARPDRVGGLPLRRTSGATRDWLARALGQRAVPRAGQHLRGAPRLVAAGTVLSGARRPADRVRGTRWASPTSSSCR